jgi:hypothetical protein
MKKIFCVVAVAFAMVTMRSAAAQTPVSLTASIINLGDCKPQSVTNTSQVLVFLPKTKQLAVWNHGHIRSLPLRMPDEVGCMNDAGHVLVNLHYPKANFYIWDGVHEREIHSPLIGDDAGVCLNNEDQALVNDERGVGLFGNGSLRVLIKRDPVSLIQARSVNSHDEIVGDRVGPLRPKGFHLLPGQHLKPVLEQAFFCKKETFHVFKTLGKGNLWACSVNDSEEVAGYFRPKGGFDGVAVFWPNPDAAPILLQSLLPKGNGWQLRGALGINNRHQIVGVGTYNGVRSGFLMTVKPGHSQHKA